MGDADEPEELEVGDGVEHTDVTVDKDDEGHDTHSGPKQNQKQSKFVL